MESVFIRLATAVNAVLRTLATAILVVEDDDGVPLLLRQELESRGYGVWEARSQIAESPPDLITLDILMPDMDGFELARRLKSHTATVRIPIAVISVLDRCEGGLRIEADRYFTKPLDVELLVQDVRRLLTEKEQRVLVGTHPQDGLTPGSKAWVHREYGAKRRRICRPGAPSQLRCHCGGWRLCRVLP